MPEVHSRVDWEKCALLRVGVYPYGGYSDMRPHDVVKEVERALDEYKHGENVTPKRKIDTLLRSLTGFTSYTDEMIEGVQKAYDFYGWENTECHIRQE
jgi:hypothetical protein